MTGHDEPLGGAESVHGVVRKICFKTGPPSLVGAELEWLVGRRDDPRAVVPLVELTALLRAAEPCPGGSRITLEPGGQVELSSVAAGDLPTLRTALSADVTHLRTVLLAAGLDVVPRASDPHRPPLRQLRAPRYDAMEAYFDRLPHRLGRVMMTGTASVQVNLDAGADHVDVARRWHLLHTVGPTLTAAFANSPGHRGPTRGWRSARQAVWWGLEPRRTHPPVGEDPVAAWADYALQAPVMTVRTADGPWAVGAGFSFEDWAEGRVTGLRPPSEDDLVYHLGTLFPPVRPRGWFEVRYLDAQGPRWWPVPVAVLATLLDHPDSALADAVTEACEPVAGEWLLAARAGLTDQRLEKAARVVFEQVGTRIADPGLRDLVAQFEDEYVAQGRCPAEDKEELR